MPPPMRAPAPPRVVELKWPTELSRELAAKLVDFLNLTSPQVGYRLVLRGRGAKITVGDHEEEVAALESRQEEILREIDAIDEELDRLS